MKRPIWKILGIAAAALVILAGGAALRIRSVAAQRQAAMEERLRAMSEEHFAPDLAPRPGKYEGNAWDDYLPALAEAAKVRPPDKLTGILANTDNADHAFGEAALAAHGSAIDLLLEGARRTTCVAQGPVFRKDLWSYETLGKLAVLKARKLTREGKTAEAVEILFALAQFGRDLGESGVGLTFASGQSTVERAFEELRDHLRSASLTPDALAGLESRLAFLENSFLRPEAMRLQRMQYLGEHFTGIAQHPGWEGRLQCWRYGFSRRLLAATAFDDWDRWLKRSEQADHLPWPQAQALIASIRSQIDATHVPKEYTWSGQFLEDGSRHRSVLAHLRLLRTAARYVRTGEILELDDPFGGKLLHRESNRRLKLWSVGRDGVDQGGTGNWDSRVIEDIVLEVIR